MVSTFPLLRSYAFGQHDAVIRHVSLPNESDSGGILA